MGSKRGVVVAGVVWASLGAPACVERVIYDQVCGDGRRSAGELCLGAAPSFSLRVDDLDLLSLRAADFDGDGSPDLLVMGIDAASGAVAGRLWRGDGTGDLLGPIDPGVTGCSAYPVPGSIDDDAIDDLLVDDCGDTVSLFRGTSSGVFEPALTVFTGAQTISSGLLDLDADGQREVVLHGIASGGPVLTVTERELGGAFAPPVVSPILGFPAALPPDGFGGIFGFDGDSNPDALLVQGGQPEGIFVARGQPGLSFGVAEPVAPPGLTAAWATARDLDGNGRDEVLAASFDPPALVVLDAVGDRLEERARTEVAGLGPGLVVLADLDGDDRVDFLRVEAGSGPVLHVWRGQASGRFERTARIELVGPVDQIELADLNGDGALDLIVGSFEAAVVRVWMNEP